MFLSWFAPEPWSATRCQHVPTCPNGRAQQDEGERHAYENTNPKCFKCVQALSQNCRTPQKVKACLWDSIQFHGQPSVRFPHLQPQASSGTPKRPNVRPFTSPALSLAFLQGRHPQRLRVLPDGEHQPRHLCLFGAPCISAKKTRKAGEQ